MGLDAAANTAVAAARLAKSDLATSVVMEMTDLAGTMGRHYAYKQVCDMPGATCESSPCLAII